MSMVKSSDISYRRHETDQIRQESVNVSGIFSYTRRVSRSANLQERYHVTTSIAL